MNAKHVVSAVVTILFCFGAVNSIKEEPRKFDPEEVDRNLRESLKCRHGLNPGLAVSIVKDGEIIFSRGFGVTDPHDPSVNVTENTRFGIASVSKSFAATLLVKLLYEKTNLTVDSKVRELVGSQFQLQDELRARDITFADLMAHRTAIPPNNKIRFDTNLTRKNIMERLPLLETPHQFRVKYMYSNIIYGLVTRLAEIIGEDSWENLIRKHLYGPLGMDSSDFATTIDFSQEDIARGVENDRFSDVPMYMHVSPTFSKKWADMAGSGSVMSTAKDMTQWMRFHLNKGKDVKGQQVMDDDHLKEVHKPRFYIGTSSSKETRIPQFPVTSTESLYNHGLRSGFYRGYPRMTHTGSTLGYRAQMSLLPDQKIGVFTGFTGGDDNFYYRTALSLYLMDEALGVHDPWLNGTTLCTFPGPYKNKKSASAPPKMDLDIKLKKDVSEYEGTYHNPGFGYLQVTYNESMRSLVLTYGWGTWQLLPQYTESSKRDKFYGRGMGINDIYRITPLDFLEDPKNSSAIKELKIAGFESRLPPVFLKGGPMKNEDTGNKSGENPKTGDNKGDEQTTDNKGDNKNNDNCGSGGDVGSVMSSSVNSMILSLSFVSCYIILSFFPFV